MNEWWSFAKVIEEVTHFVPFICTASVLGTSETLFQCLAQDPLHSR